MASKAKYHISVLMDMDNSSKSALRSAVELAKTLGGRVEALYIKSPLKVVKQANQFSAKRDLYEDSRLAKSTIQDLTKTMGENESLDISYTISYGNVKNKLKSYLRETNPDILVLGKPKYRALGGVEEKLTLLIVGEKDNLLSFKDLSLGIFGDSIPDAKNEILQVLKKETTQPIRLFSIKKGRQNDTSGQETDNKTVSYVFSEGTNAIDGLTSYVERTKTQLFCIPKTKSVKFSFQSDETEQLLRKVNVPVLLLS
ncbi:universal stress protein [Flagellimonas meridianipacifica]|uniref:Universal stress protein family protein n=1 Tax=Flagellimonas meridianipacifica TaxID=1080225 RepID=A0A2T0MBV6_9FLAO|nr:universal stress protein [Allomuricauda pacifica]PRX54984.1 universal stress protein family protein [Allomuricauda pacifica]